LAGELAFLTVIVFALSLTRMINELDVKTGAFWRVKCVFVCALSRFVDRLSV
jgi:hypothetical protein